MPTLITGPLDTLPAAPDPAVDTPTSFSTKAAAMVLALKNMVTQLITIISQINTVTTEVNTNTTTASTAATTATGAATAASGSATAAAASATAAAGSATTASGYAASLSGSSTTSLAIALGAKNFTTSLGKQWGVGQYLIAASAADPTNYMLVQVGSYNPANGALNTTAVALGGSGTKNDWSITLAAPKGEQGTAGVGITPWIRKTTTYTAAANERIRCSTTAGGWALTMPPNPTDGDTLELCDIDGTFDTNNLTLTCNAGAGNAKIMGYTTTWVLNTKYLHPSLVYDSTTNNWGI